MQIAGYYERFRESAEELKKFYQLQLFLGRSFMNHKFFVKMRLSVKKRRMNCETNPRSKRFKKPVGKFRSSRMKKLLESLNNLKIS